MRRRSRPRAPSAVEDVVAKQVAMRHRRRQRRRDEQARPTRIYVRHRVTGIAHRSRAPPRRVATIMVGRDRLDHPDFHDRARQFRRRSRFPAASARSPMPTASRSSATSRISRRRSRKAQPGRSLHDRAVARHPHPLCHRTCTTRTRMPTSKRWPTAMRTEYEAIVGAGFLLQIDCPDLGSARNNQYRHLTDDEFRRIAERNIAALNAATDGLPRRPDAAAHLLGQLRGAAHARHRRSPRSSISAFKARPLAFSFEGANPRHEHEWEDLAAIRDPRRQGADPRRDRFHHQFRRASAPRGAAHLPLRRHRRPRARHRRRRLRLRHRRQRRADRRASIVWAKFKALADGAQIASGKLWE